MTDFQLASRGRKPSVRELNSLNNIGPFAPTIPSGVSRVTTSGDACGTHSRKLRRTLDTVFKITREERQILEEEIREACHEASSTDQTGERYLRVELQTLDELLDCPSLSNKKLSHFLKERCGRDSNVASRRIHALSRGWNLLVSNGTTRFPIPTASFDGVLIGENRGSFSDLATSSDVLRTTPNNATSVVPSRTESIDCL